MDVPVFCLCLVASTNCTWCSRVLFTSCAYERHVHLYQATVFFFSLSLDVGMRQEGELKIVYYAGVGGGVSQRVNTLRDTVLSYTESPRRASH